MADDFVELLASTGETRLLIEQEGGWWSFDEIQENWKFSKDRERGFVTSVDPPGGPHIALGSVFLTHRARRLVVASIMLKGRQLNVILMPEEKPANAR